jgi:ATP-dependent protease ClpP protease subunit
MFRHVRGAQLMPNWDTILKEIAVQQTTNNESAFDKVRRKYLKRTFDHTGRNIIAYYSGFLTKPRIDGTEINDEDKNGFMLCIHGLKRERGLDLILHTPGGDGAATASLVEYLRSMFGRDIRAIVPQIAMSAGTMIASSCREILMGKQSSLGPIDPQYGVIAAANLLAEVRKAKDEIAANPNMALFWNPILSKITPSFLERCEWAVKDSNEFLESTLGQNMFLDLPLSAREEKIAAVKSVFANNEGRAHNTHIQVQQCQDAGLNVVRLEQDQRLQDLVLTVHHCYMHTLANTPAFKITENHLGRAIVRIQQQMVQLVQQPAMSLDPSGPA